MKLDRALHPVLLDLATTQRKLTVAPEALVTPEQQELERLLEEQKEIRSAASSAQMAVDDMELDILRIQEDERKLRRREADNKQQLQSETDPEKRKDLDHDLYAAKSRIADLMSELKECHNEIAALRNNRDVHGARVDDIARQIELAERSAEAANAASAHLQDPQARIAELRAQLPEEVLAAYEEQRVENEVGAAFFNKRTCGSCFLVLPAADRTRINNAPADELPQCPNCGSYLVRSISVGEST